MSRDHVCSMFLMKEMDVEEVNVTVSESKKTKKRRRDKHRARYSPELVSSQNTGKHHSRKRKSSDLPGEQEAPRQGIKLFVSILKFSSYLNYLASFRMAFSNFGGFFFVFLYLM